VVSADVEFRLQLCERLASLRWRVWQAGGGAEALMQMEAQPVTALLLDGWLPDLEVARVCGPCKAALSGD